VFLIKYYEGEMLRACTTYEGKEKCIPRFDGKPNGRPRYRWEDNIRTLSLLMSYIYMELLVKPEILTSFIYGLTFGNAEGRLFLFAAKCFNIESIQIVFLCHSCV
jgi:hypothetical protein